MEGTDRNNFTRVQCAVACTMHNLLLERLLLRLRFPFPEDKVLTDNTLPDIPNILDDGFEVRSCIIRTSDEYVVSLPRGYRRVERANAHKPVIINNSQHCACSKKETLLLIYRSEKLEPGDDFALWLIRLDNGTNNGNVYVLSADVVRR